MTNENKPFEYEAYRYIIVEEPNLVFCEYNGQYDFVYTYCLGNSNICQYESYNRAVHELHVHCKKRGKYKVVRVQTQMKEVSNEKQK